MEETIKEKLDRIIEELDKKEEKKFKLPLNIRMKKGIFKRKNYAVVQFIRSNGGISFKILKIEDNAIKVGDVYYDASADYILRYKRYPLLIIPEWSIEPLKAFSPRDNFQEAAEKGRLTSAEKVILTGIKLDALKKKFNMSIGTLLIILVVIGGGIALLKYLKVF